jgi:hypothetical protein
MTWGSFRDQLILEYEIPKWDGDLGTANAYVALDKRVVQRKVATLMSVYGTQRSKDWFAPDVFLALMRLRGVECRSPSGYAEAFSCHKTLLRLT